MHEMLHAQRIKHRICTSLTEILGDQLVILHAYFIYM